MVGINGNCGSFVNHRRIAGPEQRIVSISVNISYRNGKGGVSCCLELLVHTVHQRIQRQEYVSLIPTNIFRWKAGLVLTIGKLLGSKMRTSGTSFALSRGSKSSCTSLVRHTLDHK